MMTRKKLYRLAEEAGLTIQVKGERVTVTGEARTVVVFYPKSIVRGDIDLSVASNMTVREAAQTLGLTED